MSRNRLPAILATLWAAFRHLLVLLAIIAGTTPAFAAGETSVPRSQRAPEVRVTGTKVVLPIVMVREFPFVEGSVAGVTGKFMLDTGEDQALAVNDHRVPVADAQTLGVGHFGSGQRFATRLAPELRDVRLGGLAFARATKVQTQDATQLEHITPDFLGWFGYAAWGDHAMKLDYAHGTATFYRGGPQEYLKGERLIADLPFETRKLPNNPIMAGRIGDMAIAAAWDTGQYGTLFTSEAGKARLLQSGRLTPSRDKPDSYDLHGLRLEGRAMPDILGLEVQTTPFPAAAPIGLTEPDILTIGYGLLRQFKTVWDFRGGQIYLLGRHVRETIKDQD